MAHVVIGVKKEFVSKVPELLKDNLVSRQSIVTRDAAALDMKSDLHLVVVEGSEPGVAKAREIFHEIGEPLPEKEALEVLQKIKEQEEKASIGVGMIFDA